MDASALRTFNPPRFAPPGRTPDAATWMQEYACQRDNLSGLDIADELASIDDVLANLFKRGDAELLGRVIISVASAYAGRLADRYVFGAPSPHAQSAAQAAAIEMGEKR